MVGMCDFSFIDSFDSMGCNVRRSKHIKPVLVPLYQSAGLHTLLWYNMFISIAFTPTCKLLE